MHLKTGFYILLASFLLTSLISCLGGQDEIEQIVSTDAQISSFSIANSSISSLASAKFSIDQVNGEIYNYDSLPYLTSIPDSVMITYTTGSNANQSLRIIAWNDSTSRNDTIWKISGDSLDLAKMSQFTIFAPDGQTNKLYSLKINIHQIDPDSVQFHLSNISELPVPEPPAVTDISENCPYPVISYLGFLRPLEKKGLALIVKQEEEYHFAFSEDLIHYELGSKIPAGFPVSGFTALNNSDFAGRLTIISNLQSVWATEDGKYWTNLFATQAPLPVIEGGNVFAYNGEIWFMNGKIVKDEEGNPVSDSRYNRAIYYSRDGGVVWQIKPDKAEAPEEYVLRQDADVTVDAAGKYFYISGGHNETVRTPVLTDVWKVALNSRLFEH